MDAFIKHKGIVAPLDRSNVDTDQIIPNNFLKELKGPVLENLLFLIGDI